eukprot:TRINITY_DN4841_c0_g1_i1.p1 TRINITY_DN4841_c0_g1~~TRINITY_DN4841_c0_g1_i1.p1  ORF type:complete len:143 (-),score=49.32 TRINITY_DN4841_c0_g1_i1:563-991(-)
MSDQLSQEQKDEYRDVFNHFAKNQGSLDTKGFGMLMKALGEDLNESELAAIMSNSKTITADAFIKNREEKWAKEQSGEEVKAAFEVFDVQGSGTVASEELRRLMTTMGEVMNDKEINSLIADAGGEGNINYNDFVDKMKRKT